jgi:hypothetical protein
MVFAYWSRNHNFFGIWIFFVILCFQKPTANFRNTLRLEGMIVHVYIKSISFVEFFFHNFLFWKAYQPISDIFWGLKVCFSMPVLKP